MQDKPLIGQACVACRGGVPSLTRTEAEALMPQTPDWIMADDAKSIQREFTFKGKTAFVDAQAFIMANGPKIGALAEAQGHHPDIAYGWGYVRVVLTTHAIKGLHQNDFIMAAKIDALLK